MVQAVIFDLDGTLLDTSESIVECASYAADTLGCPPLPREQLLGFIGPPLNVAFPRYFGLDNKKTEEAVRLFRRHYQDGAIYHARPYEGIFSLCETLRNRGIRMAVATNKLEPMARRLLAHFDLARYLDPICGSVPEGSRSKADCIRLCLEEFRLSPEQAVLIGDTEYDAEGAKGVGTPFLAVTYGFGFRSPEDTAGRSFFGTADSPMGAAKILLGE